MAAFSEYGTESNTKLLILGDSGAGKTGALFALLEAGYNLRILDFDKGADVLKNLIKQSSKPQLMNQVDVEVVTDGTRLVKGRMIPGATAWTKALKTLEDWPGLGNIGSWGSKDILVLDSLTFAGRAAVRFVLNLNGRITDLPQFQDYLTAQTMVDQLLATLYSDDVKCNVIVISHVKEIAKTRTEVDSKGRQIQVEEEGTRKGYAETGTGRALSPTVGRYFNSVLLVDIEGSGPATRRVIRTVPHTNIGLKNSAPGLVRPSYPLATGLADYFKAVRGEV